MWTSGIADQVQKWRQLQRNRMHPAGLMEFQSQIKLNKM